MKPVLFGCAILLLLPVAQAVAPNLFHFLPLGGSVIAEIGIVLGATVAIVSIRDALRRDK